MIIFVLLFLLLTGQQQETNKQDNARITLYTDSNQAIMIKLICDSSSNSSTVIEFPENSLQTVVSGWASDELSVVAKGNRLFLRLLLDKSGFFDVIGSSDKLYRLYIESVKEKPDLSVKIEFAQKQPQIKITAVELVKAMRMGVVLDGAKVIRYSNDPLYEMDGIKFYALYSYTYGFYLGYILRVENHSKSSYEIDVTRFRSDGLLLVGTTTYQLPPGQKGYVFCVFYR
ncbi:MAG: hypothetical protein HY606_07015 [Planctomycetes bacterium]|nr:hypothetical protein [Planctomycetota bacterium]